MLLDDCPICRIIRGELPAYIVHRSAWTLAFLHIAPINPGHMLVVPLDHQGSITALPPEVQGEMMQTGSSLGRIGQRLLDGDGFNLHLDNGDCAGQGLPHVHLHVIPRMWNDGFSWNWRALPVEENAMKELAQRISAKLEAAHETR